MKQRKEKYFSSEKNDRGELNEKIFNLCQNYFLPNQIEPVLATIFRISTLSLDRIHYEI